MRCLIPDSRAAISLGRTGEKNMCRLILIFIMFGPLAFAKLALVDRTDYSHLVLNSSNGGTYLGKCSNLGFVLRDDLTHKQLLESCQAEKWRKVITPDYVKWVRYIYKISEQYNQEGGDQILGNKVEGLMREIGSGQYDEQPEGKAVAQSILDDKTRQFHAFLKADDEILQFLGKKHRTIRVKVEPEKYWDVRHAFNEIWYDGSHFVYRLLRNVESRNMFEACGAGWTRAEGDVLSRKLVDKTIQEWLPLEGVGRRGQWVFEEFAMKWTHGYNFRQVLLGHPGGDYPSTEFNSTWRWSLQQGIHKGDLICFK